MAGEVEMTSPAVGSCVLLQQLEDLLLHGVRLREGADAGLAQYLVLREVTGGLAVVRRLNGA